MSAAEAVADAGLHVGLAIAPRIEITRDVAIAVSQCVCEFTNNGTLVGRGKATTALNGPVLALRWLLKVLPGGFWAGDIVATGSMIGATPVGAGHRRTNRLHGLLTSSVEITFT